MEAEFWLQRWREGRTGFHRDAPMPLLVRHWASAQVPERARVLVPLCGKSLDMLWLAEQGHRVLGVELSPLAIEQFLDHAGLSVRIHESREGRHYVGEHIELIQGDVFELDDATLSSCQAIYDRAAVVALPPAMRERYAQRVYRRLPADARGLMITLEYPQEEKVGPPFSVTGNEVHTLLDAHFEIRCVERRDILASQTSFIAEGVTALHTGVYALRRLA